MNEVVTTSRGDCPGFLFHFLTKTSLPDAPPARGDASIATEVLKRQQATLLYDRLEDQGLPERLADVQREDVGLVPSIVLGGPYALPRNAKYDVVCSTDNPDAMAQLRQGFDDSTRAIRGLRLKFGENQVSAKSFRDIKVGVAREQNLNSIELKTHPANTAAETEVFRAVGINPNIKQLSVGGNLSEGHRHGVITALSNASLENVAIQSKDEASYLRMLNWAADAGNAGAASRNLWIESQPTYRRRHESEGEKTQALAKWNAAVVRLAESRTTKCLHLPWDIRWGLTSETRRVLEAAATKMEVV